MYLNIWHVLGESLILLADLESQFTSVAHDQAVNHIFGRFQLLQSSQHKDSSFTHTRLGLAQNVHSQHCLWDALVLNYLNTI
jgi:hypothetical protein